MKSIQKAIVILGAVFLSACGDNQDENVKTKDEADQISVNSTLTNLPPAEGSCIGWEKSLAEGDVNKVDAVATCLKALSKVNRVEATKQAEILKQWKIVSHYENTLPILINTLIAFQSDEELKVFLSRLNLLNGKGAFEDDDDVPSLLPDSYFLRFARVYWFDVETGTFPNNHDYLLDSIANLSVDFSDVKFNEVAPSDSDEDRQPYKITADLREQHFEQKAQNYGDWYDVEAVLNLLNNIAITIGSNDRFITLPMGDQTTTVMVIETIALKELVDKGLILMGENTAAMLLGKAAEEKVRGELGESVQ